MTTEERLAKVERELEFAKRRSRWLLVGLALGLGALSLVWVSAASTPSAEAQGAASGPPAAGIVKAREFRLVDAAGKVRAILGMGEDGPGLDLLDENGKPRAMLRALKDGPGLVLSDENGETRLGLAAIKNGPRLDLFDENGKYRVGLAAIKEGPRLILVDENGKVRAGLRALQDGSGLDLYDAAGKPIWSAP